MDKLNDNEFYQFADSHKDCPESFKCPISLSLMKEPYALSDGYTYDKKTIDNLNTSPEFLSPLTREVINLSSMKKNFTLISLMDEWLNKIYLEYSGNVIVEPEKNDISSLENDEDIINHDNIHLVLVIDQSGSMYSTCDLDNKEDELLFSRLDLVKHSINTIITTLKDGDYLTIVAFSFTGNIIYSDYYNKSLKDEILNKVKSLEANGSTNLASGLKLGFDEIKSVRHEKTNILILTDGEVDGGAEGTNAIIDSYLCQKENEFLRSYPITTIGFSNQSKSKYLYKLAKEFNSLFIYINDASTVASSFANFITNILFNKEERKMKNDEEVVNENDNDNNDNVNTEINNNEISEEDEIVDYYRHKYANTLEDFCFKDNLRVFSSINSDNIINNFFSEIKDFIEHNPNHKNIKFFIELYKDYEKEDGDDGEVYLATKSGEKYYKWGEHYLLAISSAHRNKMCTNFKDKSLQYYFSPYQVKISKKILNIFSSLPPLEPSARNYSYYSSYNNNNNNNANSTPPVYSRRSMSAYINVNAGCFHGDSEVLLADNSTIKISDLKGDEILFNNYTIKYVVKFQVNKITEELEDEKKKIENEIMSEVNGVKVTCYHPMKYGEKWIFPIDHPDAKTIPLEGDSIYNLALNEGHFVVINGQEFITLGHNINEFDENNEILKHDFYGTEEVIKNLEEFKVDKNDKNEKFIYLKDYIVERSSSTNLVCGFKKI